MSRESAGTAGHCLAIDIGATKFAVAVVEPEGRVCERVSEQVAGSRNPFEILVDLIHRVDVAACGTVGVASAGPFDGDGIVSPLNLPQWQDFPLGPRLQDVVGLPVSVVGDVHALALAESRFGAARGLSNFLSMVVSTGVGGAFFADGRVVTGRTGNAGHVGHLVVNPDGRSCACGSRGCLEAEASGRAILEMTGLEPIHAPPAMRQRVGETVGRAVGTLASVMDFEECFIGGSVALGYGALFFDAATGAARGVAKLGFSKSVRVAPSALGPDGALLGAALVGWGVA